MSLLRDVPSISPAVVDKNMKRAPDPAAVATAAVPAATEKYVGELDGICAIAVSFVVFAHYQLLPHIPGGFGVTLFFFLSGYLITTLFFAEFRSTLRISIPQFYLRRWLRLTPPLVISVVLATIFYRISCHAVGGRPVPIGTTMAALFYYTNYYDLSWDMDNSRVIPFGICWSLAIEEHFYLVWPWIIYINIRSPKRLFLIITTACVSVLIWRLVAHQILLLSSDYTYMATDCRIDFDTLWRSASCVVRDALGISRVEVLADAGLPNISAAGTTDDVCDPGQELSGDLPVHDTRHRLDAVVHCGPLRRSAELVRKGLASPPMVLIGRLSYSIYLFHLLVRTPGEVYFGSVYRMGPTVSGLVLIAAVAYGLFIFVERPIAGLRRRFRATTVSAHSEMTMPLAETAMISVPRSEHQAQRI